MAKEFEKAGLPIVQLTALPGLAQGIGTNRIVAGNAITNPAGDYRLDEHQEYNLVKLPVVAKCLRALETEVTEPTILA